MLFAFQGHWDYWGLAAALVTVILLVALFKAPWRQLLQSSLRQHTVALSILGLAVFWQLNVHVEEQFILHPLGMMWLVMACGPALAMLAGSLALVLSAFMGDYVSMGLAVPLLTTVIVPALAGALVLRLIDRIPQRNLFVYMLGAGFAGAMLTVQAMAAVQWLYVWALGPAPLLVIVEDYYYLTWLMMFPEGFINGALVTVLTVFTPDLVKTFDDHHYLDDQQS